MINDNWKYCVLQIELTICLFTLVAIEPMKILLHYTTLSPFVSVFCAMYLFVSQTLLVTLILHYKLFVLFNFHLCDDVWYVHENNFCFFHFMWTIIYLWFLIMFCLPTLKRCYFCFIYDKLCMDSVSDLTTYSWLLMIDDRYFFVFTSPFCFLGFDYTNVWVFAHGNFLF